MPDRDPLHQRALDTLTALDDETSAAVIRDLVARLGWDATTPPPPRRQFFVPEPLRTHILTEIAARFQGDIAILAALERRL